jgi:hypothetical protein
MQCFSTSGIASPMAIPEQFRDYRCSDYFNSEQLVRGVWSESEQLHLIVEADEVLERPGLDFLVIGRPGVDGIEFGYRKRHDGIWAYYPISREFSHIASSINTLVEGWFAGSIKI